MSYVPHLMVVANLYVEKRDTTITIRGFLILSQYMLHTRRTSSSRTLQLNCDTLEHPQISSDPQVLKIGPLIASLGENSEIGDIVEEMLVSSSFLGVMKLLYLVPPDYHRRDLEHTFFQTDFHKICSKNFSNSFHISLIYSNLCITTVKIT